MYTFQHNPQIEEITEKLYLLSNKIDILSDFVEKQFKQLDVKKIKRNRTTRNRCQYFHASKKRNCMSFICSGSKSLCYSHYCKSHRGEDVHPFHILGKTHKPPERIFKDIFDHNDCSLSVPNLLN